MSILSAQNLNVAGSHHTSHFRYRIHPSPPSAKCLREVLNSEQERVSVELSCKLPKQYTQDKKGWEIVLSHRYRLGLEAMEELLAFLHHWVRDPRAIVWWMSEPHEVSKKEGFSQEHLPHRKVQ